MELLDAGSASPGELVITLNRVRMKEFVAGFVGLPEGSDIMEINPTLSIELSDEIVAPFLDENAPDPTAKLRHLIRLPWRKKELVFGLQGSEGFRFPLLTNEIPAHVMVLFTLIVDTETSLGQPGTKSIGVGSVRLQDLQTGNGQVVEIINRPAVAAGYGRNFWLKGILHLEDVAITMSPHVQYVQDSEFDLAALKATCDKVTDKYYEFVNACKSLTHDLASVHTPFYASDTLPSTVERAADVPMIPASLLFDRRVPDAYKFQPSLFRTCLVIALDQCNLTKEEFLTHREKGVNPKIVAKAIKCAHLAITLLPICMRYGYDEAYGFVEGLGVASPPWDPVQDRVTDQEKPHYSLLAPTSRLMKRTQGPAKVSEEHPHIYTVEDAEEDMFEEWARQYVTPTVGRRGYGVMNEKHQGGTDDASIPMQGGENIMDCEDGALFCAKWVQAMDHVISRTENPEDRALFETLQNIYDSYIYARTVNWCHGGVCHILTIAFEKHGFYKAILQGIKVVNASPTVHVYQKAELERLETNVSRELESLGEAPSTFTYPSMLALETTSKAAARLDGVPSPQQRATLTKLDRHLQTVLKNAPDIHAQWQFTMQTNDLEDQDSMRKFIKYPGRNPLYGFYDYITVADVAHDLPFQSDAVAWMSFLVSENYGKDPRRYLSSNGKPVYGARVQRMALHGYVLLPALPVTTEQRLDVNRLLRADPPMSFLTSPPPTYGNVTIQPITTQPRHDMLIPTSSQCPPCTNPEIQRVNDPDTVLRKRLANKLIGMDSQHLVKEMVPLQFYVVEELFSSEHVTQLLAGIERLERQGVFYGFDYDIFSLTRSSESAVDAINGEFVSRETSGSYIKTFTSIYCVKIYCKDVVRE